MGTSSDDRNLHKDHRNRLRERFFREGAMNLEPHVLLELYLFDALPRVDTNPIAHRLIDKFGSLDGVFSATEKELLTVKGIGPSTAAYIRRTAYSVYETILGSFLGTRINTFESAADLMIFSFRKDPDAVLAAAFLDEERTVIRIDRFRSEKLPVSVEDTVSSLSLSVPSDRVLIGILKGVEPPDPLRFREGLEIIDIIEISGYNAVSLIP